MRLNFFMPLFIVAAAFTFAFNAPTASAAVSPGTLIKSSASAAVYLYGDDGKRHAFPNERIFKTWFVDFSSVTTVSATELAAIPLGKNVSYRPGSRLLKLTTDPKTYAVGEDGKLYWVSSEQSAMTLYGNAWNAIIDDVPDAFFVDYVVTDETIGTLWPDGTIVKSSTGIYFEISDGMKRRVATGLVSTLSRYAVTDNGQLATLTEGENVTALSRPFVSTFMSYPETPTFSSSNDARSIGIGSGAVLSEFGVSSAKAVLVNKIAVKIKATKNTSGTKQPDDDLDGLVYGNNIRANLSGLTLVSSSGAVLMGPMELVNNIASDQEQTIVFSGNVSLPANSETRFVLKANVNESVPISTAFTVTIVKSGTEMLSSGVPVAFLPSADLSAGTATVRTSSMLVSFTGGATTVARGASNVTVGNISLKNGSAESYLRRLDLTGYLNNGGGLYGEGGSAGSGLEMRVREIAPVLSLYNGDVLLSGPKEVAFDGRVSFDGLNVLIAANGSLALRLVSNVPSAAMVMETDVRVAFDVIDAASAVSAVNAQANAVTVEMPVRNVVAGGARSYLTVRQHGKLKTEWVPSGGRLIAGESKLIGKVMLTPEYEDFTVSSLAFWQDETTSSFPNVRLEYVGADGLTRSKRLDANTLALHFTELDIPVTVGKTTTVSLYVESVPQSAGAVYGETMTLNFRPDLLYQFRSSLSNMTFSGSDLTSTTTGDFYFKTGADAEASINFGNLTATKSSDSPTGGVWRYDDSPVLRFSLAATGTRARISKISFKLSPKDAGKSGTDSLENWLAVNYGYDANDVGDLLRLGPASSDNVILGEGSDVSLSYKLYRNSRLLTDTVNYVSAAGDYAILEYLFNENSEYSLAVGETANFEYRLDLSKFWQATTSSDAVDIGLGVEMTASGFVWTDDPGPSFANRSASGLPISSALTVKK